MASAIKLQRPGQQGRCICSGLIILAAFLAGCASDENPSAERLAEYQEHYHNPLLSPGAQFATLPPAVQRTVRAEAGAGEISDIVKDTNGNSIVYCIYFLSPVDPPLFVAPDGALLDPDLSVAIGAAQDTVGVLTGGPVTGITLSDLPAQVVKTIQQRAPDAEVAYINKETHGQQLVYLVVFKDQMHPALRINSDGTLASEHSTPNPVIGTPAR
jgi:hypothetical protein